MRREFSASLDVLRFAAACVVFFDHLSDVCFGALNNGHHGMDHNAVVVFFVLSGCVISWAAGRDKYPAYYFVSRAARIYSVAVPALVLTFILDVATGNITYQHLQPWKYVPIFLSFTTDIWFLSENAFSNAPWWSLCYEVWYYVLFGIAFFGRGRWRWILALACLAVMGPRLWLLFPVWLMGVAVNKAPKLPHARAVLAIGVVSVLALKFSGLETVLNDMANAGLLGFAKAHLRYSQYFLGDYVFGGLVALIIWALRDAELRVLAAIQRPASALASVTFSIYLMHLPLMLAFSHVFPKNMAALGIPTLLGTVAFGIVFERNKRVARELICRVLQPLPIWPAYPTAMAAAAGPGDGSEGAAGQKA